MTYYLSLGSNIGNLRKNLEQAMCRLQELGRLLKVSSPYKTSPVGIKDSPDFVNRVLCLESALPPQALLLRIQGIEAAMGRSLRHSHMKPRIIDIDILLAGRQKLETPELTIPHPRMTERAFVLVPLVEIAPCLVHPLFRRRFSSFIPGIGADQRIRRLRELGRSAR